MKKKLPPLKRICQIHDVFENLLYNFQEKVSI